MQLLTIVSMTAHVSAGVSVGILALVTAAAAVVAFRPGKDTAIDLPVDRLDTRSDGGFRWVANHPVELVVAGVTTAARRETKEALDDLPFHRRPFRHPT